MRKGVKDLLDIFARYLILVLVALPNLYLFYFIFTPLTVYPVYVLLSIFFDVSLIGNVLMIGDSAIELIDACIAGSAYYLLLILNLSIPKINLKKRIHMVLLSFLVFLVLNIFRIFILSVLFLTDFIFFDITHKLFWYSLSIIFVVGIWFAEVKLFKLKQIPFYSDIKYLLRLKSKPFKSRKSRSK